MKKTIAAVLAAVSISLAAGCAANLPAGYDKFTAAREKYETLSSGRVTMTDLTTGDEIMRFSFYFNVNDEMVFSYWGSWQGEEQQAYSDGAEFFYKESGDEKWTVISSDDDGYIYNVYNRGYRYPYAEGRLFFLAGEAVRNAGIIESGDGPTSITYTYDPEKLNSASMPGVQEDIQSFERLTTTLEIDQQGYPSSFTEDGSSSHRRRRGHGLQHAYRHLRYQRCLRRTEPGRRDLQEGRKACRKFGKLRKFRKLINYRRNALITAFPAVLSEISVNSLQAVANFPEVCYNIS